MRQKASKEYLKKMSDYFEDKTPQEILEWSIKNYSPAIALACSFGVEDIVLVDMVTKIGPKTKIFCLDTDLFFKETYETIDKVIERYGIQPLIYKPKISLEEQAKKYGEKLWERDPDLCCGLRKVEPLSRALKELKLKAWITGMRREQSPTRKNIGKIEWDNRWNLVKINPLANWSSKEVWRYAIKKKLPYNPLHDRGYPSIGCEPCTEPVEKGAYERRGRWKGLTKKECGIHYKTSFDETKRSA